MGNVRNLPIPNLFEIVDKLLAGQCTNQQARFWTMQHYQAAMGQQAQEQDPAYQRSCKIADDVYANQQARAETAGGGEARYDGLFEEDWISKISEAVEETWDYIEPLTDSVKYREQLVKYREQLVLVAALAIDAVTTLDRKIAAKELH